MKRSTRTILLVLAVAAILLGLFIMLRPTPGKAPGDVKQVSISLGLVGGKLATGDGTLTVRQGQTVVLDIVSDKADEFHLHGYDKEVELQPGIHRTLRLTADKTGSFEAELHHAGDTVLVLNVEP